MNMASVPAIGSAPAVVQRKTGVENQTRSQVPPIVNEVLRWPGQPLDATTRAFMEPRFGSDFSHVRIHSNQVAGRSAQEVNAQAYTVGNDIVFGSGRFAPETPEGRHLLSHELTHVIQQSGEGTTTLQRQPVASGAAATVGQEEKPAELSPSVRSCSSFFSKFEKKVIGDEVFDKIETQKAWDDQKEKEKKAAEKYEEDKKKYKEWEEGGRIGPKPPLPIPVAKFTTCIATQQVLLTEAFKESGLTIKKEGKLPKFALATQGAQIAEALNPDDAAGPAWHWGKIDMSERPKPGDIIVMAFRGGTIDQGAKELNYILNIKYGTAQKLKTSKQAQAKLEASQNAITEAEAALKNLQEREKPPAAWEMQNAENKLQLAVNALNAAKKAADKAVSDVESMNKPTEEELASAEAKLDAARLKSAKAREERLEKKVGSRERYIFQFSHVGFLQKIEKPSDGNAKEKWTTFDGGQLVERKGKKVEGAQTSIRYYDPKSNEISGEAQQGGEARWLYGWVDVDNLVAGK